MLIGPIGEDQVNPRPTELLNLLDSLTPEISDPQTFPKSKKILLEVFQVSGYPFGIVVEAEAKKE